MSLKEWWKNIMFRKNEQLRTVRFFHDYGAPWPLWENGSDKYSMSPMDYNLSANLTATLRECGELFEKENKPVDGWSSRDHELRYLDLMREAASQLRLELSGVANISIEVPGLR
ncbi:hypothetical protein [Austwickia sp. TVS 96-490-7B]|uniref:hypothetical protein n=1 Tax=Austwickia sp. TVS 96-490-7B TaxID=2830843 RepID=UPI001C5A26F1|nr:hypothetical protein [Austwickia sp. TVS 96-490-7B]